MPPALHQGPPSSPTRSFFLTSQQRPHLVTQAAQLFLPRCCHCSNHAPRGSAAHFQFQHLPVAHTPHLTSSSPTGSSVSVPPHLWALHPLQVPWAGPAHCRPNTPGIWVPSPQPSPHHLLPLLPPS
ncbi:hypothetical protein P7K49_002199 [Saguinus oedipus]|uniref:Uncharacterized protein n=1 Tax=Saguinus oedipus TaxID=9490 RepID=A0ABQ9WGQ2_SAGOE|nr:hypothetical protein P7K49_002199 [Saguinus oedipus]